MPRLVRRPSVFRTLALTLVLIPVLFVSVPVGASSADLTMAVTQRTGVIELDLSLPTSANAAAVGVAFDANVLSFIGYSHLEAASLLGSSSRPAVDRRDIDARPRTNRVLRLAWLDPSGKGQVAGKLAQLRFAVRQETLLTGALPTGALPTGALTVFPLSSESAFTARHWTPGSVIDGGLQAIEVPMKGAGGTIEVPYPRAKTTVAEPCSPDLDGNGVSDGLTDGLLFIRHLFGLTGTALTDGAIGSGATRRTAAQIEAFLATPDCRPMVDVDGNESTDALTDGLLFARFLLGFAGESLTAGVLAPDALRVDGDDVGVWLSYYDNPRFVIAEGMADATAEVSDIFEDLRIRGLGSEPVSVRVVEGRNARDEPVFGFEIDGEAEIEFGDPNRDPNSSNRAVDPGYPVDQRWRRGSAIFLQGPELPSTNRSPGRRYVTNGLQVYCVTRPTYELWSSCDEGDSECLGAGDPVMLIHGFTLVDDLGGGEGTWGDFPQLLSEAGATPQYVPFEFRWNTRARFQDVARELGAAIEQVALATGRQVHLVGHSFGGVLIRTLLQAALADENRFANLDDSIASVATLGAPHSGIADDDTTLHGIDLPLGRDTVFIDACRQISCHQAGEDVFDATVAEIFGVADESGQIIAEMARLGTNPIPPLPILALLGLTTDRGLNTIVDDGDGVISGWGQRIHPVRAVVRDGNTLTRQWLGLLTDSGVSNALVTERLLGFAGGSMAVVQPGSGNPESGNDGYKHINFLPPLSGATPEAYVDCAQRAGCTHDGFNEVLQWLSDHPASDAPQRREILLELRLIDGAGNPLPGANVRLMDGSSLLAKAVSGSDGRLTLPLSFVANSRFTVYANLDGFRGGVRSVRTFLLPSETPTQLGDLVLPSNQPAYGNLLGQVVDAIDGTPLAGVSYTLTRIDQVRPQRSGLTGADGGYEIRDLLAARYVLDLELDGYEPTQRSVDVLADTSNSLQIGLSPNLAGEGSARIVLTWAQNPRDLDSHLWKFRPDGSTEYHIYYASRLGTDGDFLDRDDTSSFGPETTTIQDIDPAARYLFAVFDFSGSGSIATTSEARVNVQLGSGSSRIFNPPAGGDERWWTVFEIIGGAVVPCNTACLANVQPSALGPILDDVMPAKAVDRQFH